MRPNEPPRDDPERDAWLGAALRHAPDAQASPPAALSEAILREARAAASPRASSTAAGQRSPWLSAWAWLARPPIAAGFASVMVATLVGLMWWDRPMDEALPRAPAPAREPAPVRDTAPAAMQEAARGAAPAEARRADPPRAAVPQAVAPTPAPRAAPTAMSKPSTKSAASPEAEVTAPPRAEPAPFADSRTPTAAAPAAPPEAATAAAPAVRERADASAGTAARLAASAAARDESGNAAAGALSRRATKSALAADDAATRPAALAALLASVAEQPQRWAWQRAGSPQAMTPALQRWLAQVDRATTSRWQPTDDMPSDDGAVVRLYRDAELLATLRIDGTGVRLAATATLAPAAGNSRAPLPPPALDALRRALAAAAP